MHPLGRIVRLTDDTVETLHLLGEGEGASPHRIVGVCGYAVRPPRVRREKPRVAAFTSADLPKIVALRPDLVLTFSDLQADIAAALIREGLEVHAFNQRDVAGILGMITRPGTLVGAGDKAEALAEDLAGRVAATRARAAEAEERGAGRPRVYFEEWDAPMISGIGWVSELVEAAGGVDVFGDKAREPSARGRIVTTAEVVAAAPEIIVGSWCGKRFRAERVAARPGMGGVPAVRDGELHEVRSTLILQPARRL